MSKHTTFKIGGCAKFLVIVKEIDKLVELLNFLTGEGENFLILSGGSNMLMPDDGFDGVVVKISADKTKLENGIIEAEAGAKLSDVVAIALKNSITGLEWAVGIPGTIGGAVRGNAGAMGDDMSKNILEVECWKDGEVQILKNDECGFGYRDSFFKQNGWVVLRVKLKAEKSDMLKINKLITENFQKRQTKLPTLPSAGSFFKNIHVADWNVEKFPLPEKFIGRKMVPVGWVLEQTGLKGLTVGGAKVADEHGNFIVNFNNASQKDVLKIVEIIKEKVYNKFGINIEEEVQIIN